MMRVPQRNSQYITTFYMIPHDRHIVIAVGAGLLVPEAEGMEELVFDGGDAVTTCTDR